MMHQKKYQKTDLKYQVTCIKCHKKFQKLKILPSAMSKSIKGLKCQKKVASQKYCHKKMVKNRLVGNNYQNRFQKLQYAKKGIKNQEHNNVVQDFKNWMYRYVKIYQTNCGIDHKVHIMWYVNQKC